MVGLPLFAGVAAFLAVAQCLTLAAGVAGLRMTQGIAIAIVTIAATLAVLFGARFRRIPAPRPAAELATAAELWVRRGLTALATVALGWAAWVWGQSWVLAWYRSPVGWDELWYHIPAINEWVVRGGVGFHPLDPALAAVPHEVEFAGWLNFPMGVELTGFLLYHLSGGSDRLIDAANLPYWPLAFLALVVIAGQTGATGIWRWLAGGLLFGVSLYVIQGATLYVDAGFGSATIAAIAATLVFTLDHGAPRWSSAVLLGASAGLMLGFKGVGAPFLVVVLGVAGVATFVVGGWSSWRRHLLRLGLAGSAALATGGYWYLRNAVHTGNPVYPIQLQIGHKVLAPGYDLTGYDRLEWIVRPVLKPYPPWARTYVAWLQRDLPIFQPENGPNYAPAGGLGFIWLLGGIPAAAFVLGRAVRGPRTEASKAWLLVAALVLLLYLGTPIAWQARFTFFLHALGLPAIAVVLSEAVAGWRRQRGYLVAAGLALGVIGVAAWESASTIRMEWRVGRDGEGGGLRFREAADSLWPGMRQAPGFRDLFASDRIGRGPWESTIGTLLSGVLAMPLGRRVEILPPRPDAARLRQLGRSGIEWVFWELRNDAELPGELAADARAIHRYRRDGEYDFYAVRLKVSEDDTGTR